ncbi:MAG: Pr6Pr family membrane protein [Ktedonobacterales bacterium]|nr:Pr6Pr family membrane protein [Ktedonobacterales bacterium]
MTQRRLFSAARIFFGLLDLVAITVQLFRSISLHFSVVSYFSYFTNLSNIFASVVLVIGGIYLLQGREPTVREESIRGASVVAMAIVGVVFALLLRNEDLGGLLPWVNFVLHYLMPVVVVADWLIQPPKARMGNAQITSWLIYPLVYLVYTLIRGPIAKFYPYPFVNPANGGYGTVALYCVGIFVLFLVFGGALAWLGNRFQHRIA